MGPLLTASAALTLVLEDVVRVQGHPGEHPPHRAEAVGIDGLRLHVEPAGSGEETGAEPAGWRTAPGVPLPAVAVTLTSRSVAS